MSHSGASVSMVPEPSGLPKSLRGMSFHLFHLREDSLAVDTCDHCGGKIMTGDWPFCGGDPKEHRR